MSEPPAGPVEVLSGTAGEDLRWVIVADGDDADLTTMLHVYRGDRQLAGSGFRDLTRLAESPYSMWRDICLTNIENIQSALDAMIQKLDTIKTHLSTRELENEFDQARKLRERLHEKG